MRLVALILGLLSALSLEKLSPQNTLALKTLGNLYTWKGKPNRAFAYYEAYSQTQSDDALPSRFALPESRRHSSGQTPF